MLFFYKSLKKISAFRTNETTTIIKATALRLSDTYEVYYINWVRTTLLAALPFMMLVFLNGKIIWQIILAERMARKAVQGVRRILFKREIVYLLVWCL